MGRKLLVLKWGRVGFLYLRVSVVWIFGYLRGMIGIVGSF